MGLDSTSTGETVKTTQFGHQNANQLSIFSSTIERMPPTVGKVDLPPRQERLTTMKLACMTGDHKEIMVVILFLAKKENCTMLFV